MAEEAGTAVPPDSGVYYGRTYWNDIPRVLEYMCQNFTGDPRRSWMEDFGDRFCRERPFRHGLFPNCGNGWVEREFLDRGIVEGATAFDYSPDLLRDAERDRGERPVRYFQADVNQVELEPGEYDLVVNVGALHHVQYVGRFARLLCEAMTADGVLVAFDYIGPARNQYSRAHWRLVKRINRSLPESIRRERLRRPHLPTMLHDDPTEAIHSDLVLDALGRHFEISERHDTGGGVAYLILTHNPKLFPGPLPDEVNGEIDRLLAVDREMSESGHVPPLFSYYVARPDKASLADPSLAMRQRSEDRREAWARSHLGTYSFRDYLRAGPELRARRALRLWRVIARLRGARRRLAARFC